MGVPKKDRAGYYLQYPMTGTPASSLDVTDLLIGIDDPDSLTSKGTGYLVQRLLAAREAEGLTTTAAMERHNVGIPRLMPATPCCRLPRPCPERRDRTAEGGQKASKVI